MPDVLMPDGQVVSLPDELTPELAARLKAFKSGVKPQEDGYLTKIRKAAEGVLEPALTVATGIPATLAGNIAGVGSDIYSGITGQPRVGEKVAEEFQSALTYSPRSEEGKRGLSVVADIFKSDLGRAIQGLPIVGQELPMLAEGTNLAARTSRAALGTKLQKQAEDLMRSALKPTPSQSASGAADAAISTLLERNISPNEKGLAVIEARIAKLQDEIRQSIGNSSAVISKQKVLDQLNGVRERFLRTANPQEDVAAINAAGAKFQEHPLIPNEQIPVQLAQDIKQGTYRELRGKYGEQKAADIEAQKALARGLKEEISSVVPEVGALNKEESALLNALDTVERRVYLEMNKDPIPMTGALRSPGAWAAFTADKSAAFKALAARWLYKQSQRLGSGIQPSVTPPTQPLTLAPLGENIGRESPWAVKEPATRGLLSLAEDVSPSSGLSMPMVDYSIEPRLNPLYQRGGVPQELKLPSVFSSAKLPEMPPELPPVLPVSSGVSEAYSPVSPVGLSSVAERYAGTDMPIGLVEGGGPASQNIPLPKLPPMDRGLLGLSDVDMPVPDTKRLSTRHDVPTIDFPLRQEVMSNPEIKNAIQSFVAEAERLRELSRNAGGFWRERYSSELSKLEDEFAAGMRQLGIRDRKEALGLVKLYESGGVTRLPIEKTRGLK